MQLPGWEASILNALLRGADPGGSRPIRSVREKAADLGGGLPGARLGGASRRKIY